MCVTSVSCITCAFITIHSSACYYTISRDYNVRVSILALVTIYSSTVTIYSNNILSAHPELNVGVSRQGKVQVEVINGATSFQWQRFNTHHQCLVTLRADIVNHNCSSALGYTIKGLRSLTSIGSLSSLCLLTATAASWANDLATTGSTCCRERQVTYMYMYTLSDYECSMVLLTKLQCAFGLEWTLNCKQRNFSITIHYRDMIVWPQRWGRFGRILLYTHYTCTCIYSTWRSCAVKVPSSPSIHL